MSFSVGADAYDRFMGRYSAPLASMFAEFARVRGGGRVVDVGCGTGALTDELIARLGVGSVVAVDPSSSFATSIQERHPELAVFEADAAELPFETDEFGAALAQLVVHFMTDPIAGLVEMARVTKPGGVVAACVWDHAEGGGPLNTFWDAVHSLDQNAPGEAELAVIVEHPTFENWWEPFTFGVGPAGAYVTSLNDGGRRELRDRCRELLPVEPIEVRARAWTARGLVA